MTGETNNERNGRNGVDRLCGEAAVVEIERPDQFELFLNRLNREETVVEIGDEDLPVPCSDAVILVDRPSGDTGLITTIETCVQALAPPDMYPEYLLSVLKDYCRGGDFSMMYSQNSDTIQVFFGEHHRVRVTFQRYETFTNVMIRTDKVSTDERANSYQCFTDTIKLWTIVLDAAAVDVHAARKCIRIYTPDADSTQSDKNSTPDFDERVVLWTEQICDPYFARANIQQNLPTISETTIPMSVPLSFTGPIDTHLLSSESEGLSKDQILMICEKYIYEATDTAPFTQEQLMNAINLLREYPSLF